MQDSEQGVWVRLVKPQPTRTEQHQALADAVRAAVGAELDASDVLGEFPSPNAAKSFANRVNRRHLKAFDDDGFQARTKGCQVSIAYRPSLSSRRRAS